MSAASALEWYMLDLINAERTSRGLTALQMEYNLNQSAEDHSEWMLAVDVFNHTGENNSTSRQRMDAAGFDFFGSTGSGENIAYQSIRGAAGYEDDVEDLHQALMNSSGHRANILNSNYEAIGIGIEIGEYNGFTVVMVTQNFAYTDGTLDLDTGGSGGGGTTPSDPPPSSPTKGTGGDDVLSLASAGQLQGFRGNDEMTGSSGSDTIFGGMGEDTIIGGNGSDELDGGPDADLIYGDAGDDFIFAKSHDDTVYGGSGNDDIQLGWGDDVGYGGNNNDVIRGSGGYDYLLGEGGNDSLYGDRANDTLDGGSGDDLLRAGPGRDHIYGGSGDDSLYGGTEADLFYFSSGNDTVYGFENDLNGERISFTTSSQITSYNDLMANHIRDYWGSVEIYDGLGNVMLVKGVNISDLDQGDFLF